MDRKRILSPKTHNIVLMILSLVGHLYPGKILLDCWSNGSKLQSQIMRFSINIEVPKLIMALIVLYRQGHQTAFSQTEEDSLLCGGITLMMHFMEQKLRQIVESFYYFVLCQQKYD